jgi:hypothetical protein
MRSVFSIATCAACALLLAVAGCASEVHFQDTKDISITNEFTHIVSAPTSTQKVRVEVTATDAPVNVYVMLEKDAEKTEDEIGVIKKGAKLPEAVLGHALETKDATLEVTIPAKQEYRVLVTVVTKPTRVTVKINSL